MSFDWAEYLNLAQELVGQPVNPAGREACSADLALASRVISLLAKL